MGARLRLQSLGGDGGLNAVLPMINVWATLVPHNGSAMDQRSFSLWAPNGRCLVTNEEKTSLKAACLQAATTLIAARDSMKGAVDLDECVNARGPGPITPYQLLSDNV